MASVTSVDGNLALRNPSDRVLTAGFKPGVSLRYCLVSHCPPA